MKSAGEIIVFFICLALVLFAAYYVTRFFAAKATAMHGGRSYMRVRDRLMLSRDKSILLAEIYGKYYLLAVTNQNVTQLATLTTEEVLAFASSEPPKIPLRESLASFPLVGKFFVRGRERRFEDAGRQTVVGEEDGLFYHKLMDGLAEKSVARTQSELDAITQLMERRKRWMKDGQTANKRRYEEDEKP